MLHVLTFNLAGKSYGNRGYCDVKFVHGAIVLTFINNTVLVLRREWGSEGHYKVMFRSRCLFGGETFSLTDVFSLSMRGGITSQSTDFCIRACSGDEENINVRLDGAVRFSPFGSKQYDLGQVWNWNSHNGVELPEGCGQFAGEFGGSIGFKLDFHDKLAVVEFPNGMRFPVWRERNMIRVVKTELWLKSTLTGLFVRVEKMGEDFVSFRLFIVAEGVTATGKIFLTRAHAMYDGKLMKARELMKMLILGGA